MTSGKTETPSKDLAFSDILQERAAQVDTLLMDLLSSSSTVEEFKEVLEYALSAPGKRIRSVMLMWVSELLSGRPADNNARVAAVAIEMIHTYSLIHDDLPAMDDDDFRRGRPTCHKVYDEATAILAGDALLTLAFELLAEHIDSPKLAVDLIKSLAFAAGPGGMIAGQVLDLRSENTQGDLEALKNIHINKTAKMFQCAARMGALSAGADKQQLKLLSDYGLSLGLGFQIADDILDVNGTTEELGKTPGKDEKAGKITYPALMGMDKAQKLARELTEQAIASVRSFGPRANLLRQLALAMMERKK